MIIRADHIAGVAFIALGVAVLGFSGDLPFGSLAAPGAGMMPKLTAAAMIAFAAAVLAGAAESPPLAAIDWSDHRHAAAVVVITAAAVALYQPLGFLITMTLLMLALLVVVERRPLLHAVGYSCGVTLFAYWLFGKALKSPLERGLLWF
jgi:putative tricarboxylic transport membrane protein